jgi:hypothetical protein
VTNWIWLRTGLERKIGVTESSGSPGLRSTLEYSVMELRIRKSHFKLSWAFSEDW